MDCKPYLVRYAEAEKDSRTANMICEVIVLIFSGENEEIVKDVISSFLGRKYAGLILKKAQLTRDEQIEKNSAHGYRSRGYRGIRFSA